MKECLWCEHKPNLTNKAPFVCLQSHYLEWVLDFPKHSGGLLFHWYFEAMMILQDYFELVWAADSTTMRILSATPVAYAPAIPSVIMTVNFVSLLQG